MLNRVKEMEKALKDDVVRQREELKSRQEANKKKREENLRKTEIVQVVSCQKKYIHCNQMFVHFLFQLIKILISPEINNR